MPTPEFISGAEYGLATPVTNGGGLADTVNGAVTIQGAVKHSGDFAFKFAPSGAAAYIQKSLSSTYVCGRFYVYFETLYNQASAVVFSNVSSGSAASVRYNPSTGYLALYNGSSYVNIAQITTGQWYRIDFEWDCSANPMTMKAQVDGGTEATHSAAQSATTFTNISYGAGVSTTGIAYIDSLYISVTPGDYPIGAGSVYGLRANGGLGNPGGLFKDATNTVIDATNPPDQYLDDNPFSSEVSDYIQQVSNGANNYCEVTFTDISATVIHGVQAILQYASSSTKTNNGKCVIRRLDETEITVFEGDMSESAAFYKSVIIPPPAGGWTQAEVNALTARVGYSGDTSPYPYWMAVILEVAVGEGGSPPPEITGTLSATLPAPIVTASANVAVTAQATAQLPQPTASITGAVAVTGGLDQPLPAPITSASGTVQTAGGVDAVLPGPEIQATGGVSVSCGLSAQLPPPDIQGEGTVKVEGGLDATLPAPTIEATASVSITGGLSATLPAPVITITGTVGHGEPPEIIATLTAVMPAPIVSMTGNVEITGAASLDLPAPDIQASGDVAIAASVSQVLPAPGIVASGEVAVSGGLSADLPAPLVTVSGAVTITGGVSAVMPPPVITISGSATLLQAIGAVILAIEAESRISAVNADTRYEAIEDESRVSIIPLEHRTLDIPAELRTVSYE